MHMARVFFAFSSTGPYKTPCFDPKVVHFGPRQGLILTTWAPKALKCFKWTPWGYYLWGLLEGDFFQKIRVPGHWARIWPSMREIKPLGMLLGGLLWKSTSFHTSTVTYWPLGPAMAYTGPFWFLFLRGTSECNSRSLAHARLRKTTLVNKP